MLEAIRRNSRSTLVYLFFGVIIVVFVVNFGPGSGSGSGDGRDRSIRYAVKRVGALRQTVWEAGDSDFRIAYINRGGMSPYITPQLAKQFRLKEGTMDALLERELLAEEGERLGFQVSIKEAEDMVLSGQAYIKGKREKYEDFLIDGRFDYKRFTQVCTNRYMVTPMQFLEVQRREMLADQVKQLLLAGVKVSPEEVKSDYVQREQQANLDFVRFSPRSFESGVILGADDVAEYQKRAASDIQKYYEEHSYLYKKTEKAARLRRLWVELPATTVEELAKSAEEAEKYLAAKAAFDATRPAAAPAPTVGPDGTQIAAPAGPAGPKPPTEDEKTVAARRKLDRVLRRVKAGEDFLKVVAELTKDTTSGARYDAAPYKKKADAKLGPLGEKLVFDNGKSGDWVGPLRTERGMELVYVDAVRDGDLALEQVSAEIAEEQLRTERGKEMSKVMAEAAAKKAIAEGVALAEQYPKQEGEGGEQKAPDPSALPHVDETGSFPQRGELVPKVGVSAEIVRKAFALKKGEVAGPYELSGSWVVVQLKERREADMDFFDKHKDDQTRQLAKQKWADVLDGYAKRKCIEARDAGRLRVNEELLSYAAEGAEVDAAQAHYTPCSPNKGLF